MCYVEEEWGGLEVKYCIHACSNGEAALITSGILHAAPSLPVSGPEACLSASAMCLLGGQMHVLPLTGVLQCRLTSLRIRTTENTGAAHLAVSLLQ